MAVDRDDMQGERTDLPIWVAAIPLSRESASYRRMHGGLVHDDRTQFMKLSTCALLASQSELERELMALASQPINGSTFLTANAGSGNLLQTGARMEQRRGDAVAKGGQRD